MKTTIYHNPRCSKSRQALELLQARGIEPEVVRYLDTPPTADELSTLLDMLGLEPRQLMRTKESEYTALGLDNPELGRQALIEAMVQHPRIIERPIVVSGTKAAIGRPPELILDIL